MSLIKKKHEKKVSLCPKIKKDSNTNGYNGF